MLPQRLLDATGLDDRRREIVSGVVMSWLVFVRALSVEWLTHPTCSVPWRRSGIAIGEDGDNIQDGAADSE